MFSKNGLPTDSIYEEFEDTKGVIKEGQTAQWPKEE
jgi:hypothetical protein